MGREIRMEFFDYLRPERKFPNFEALTAEVMHNADQTREFFEQHPGRPGGLTVEKTTAWRCDQAVVFFIRSSASFFRALP